MDLARTEALPRVQGGSDTEESDSEQPLTEAEQIVSILNTRASRPPPLPVEPKYAFSTSMAVWNHLRAIPKHQRTVAYDLALNTPIHTTRGVEAWIEQQLDYRRAERTIRYAFCFALNPGRSNVWVAKKSRQNPQSAGVAKGMALHLRCHPFTRSDVQRGVSMIDDLCLRRERRNNARTRLKPRTSHGSDTLDAAVVLVGFHSTARHFGAHRYRYII